MGFNRADTVLIHTEKAIDAALPILVSVNLTGTYDGTSARIPILRQGKGEETDGTI